ncbi:L,D-transpeptidase [Haloechinothrix sp. YIM 98757]|uniref:L,D-transpeptidase n=1 Tax=Haloechinothrix aidingensis TaxID=2752311 RepID=A0A837ZWT5_9PSEU|nr:L,D-transpeptidase [Haloechinothrix aidingensis]
MRTRGNPLGWGALLITTALLVAGCGGASDDAQDEDPAEPAGTKDAEVAESLSLTFTPEDEATGVVPAEPMTVEAEHGSLTEVSLVGTHGSVVDGAMNDDETAWTTAEPLGFGKTYVFEVSGVGADGETVEETSRFTTATPQRRASVRMNVPDGATVGVGMPISFQFDTAITDREAVEDAISITSTPETDGAFRWFNDSWVVWRPEDYWEPGTKVDVDAEIYGKDLGGGVFGSRDRSASMTIGDKVIARVDGSSHEMTVSVDGDTTRTIPVSLGKPSSPTPNGIYTVMSEHYDYTMDSSTYGVPSDAPDGYEITVSHATRMSYSGIFYHAAPWSVGDQGNRNVSHGCINMSTRNAEWMMNSSKPGDLIEVVNAGDSELEPTDGWSVWQMSWEEWTSGDQGA